MQALSFFQQEQGQSLFRGVVELLSPSLLMKSSERWTMERAHLKEEEMFSPPL